MTTLRRKANPRRKPLQKKTITISLNIAIMKKILFAFALLAAFQFANAQMKPAATLTKAIDAAEAAAQNPKKADKVATWIKLGQA